MRRATWILWLMLALLPLRGWAMAGMGLPQVPDAPGAVVMAEAGEHHAMPPCHQMDDGNGAPAGNQCQTCDACHGALAVPPSVVWPAAAPCEAQPPPALHRDTGRALIDGLERPPRSFLA